MSLEVTDEFFAIRSQKVAQGRPKDKMVLQLRTRDEIPAASFASARSRLRVFADRRSSLTSHVVLTGVMMVRASSQSALSHTRHATPLFLARNSAKRQRKPSPRFSIFRDSVETSPFGAFYAFRVPATGI